MLRQRPAGRAGKVLLQQRSGGDQVPYARRDHQTEQKCRCRSIVFSGSTKTGCCKVRMLHFFVFFLLHSPFCPSGSGICMGRNVQNSRTMQGCKCAGFHLGYRIASSEHCQYYACVGVQACCMECSPPPSDVPRSSLHALNHRHQSQLAAHRKKKAAGRGAKVGPSIAESRTHRVLKTKVSRPENFFLFVTAASLRDCHA